MFPKLKRNKGIGEGIGESNIVNAANIRLPELNSEREAEA